MQSITYNIDEIYEDFWIELKKKLKYSTILKTKTGRKFSAIDSDKGIVITPIASGEERTITKSEFKKIFIFEDLLTVNEKFRPSIYQKISAHASYVLALMYRKKDA